MTVGIYTLPLELLILILRRLWNIGDLTAAIASHESLAEAFANCSTTTLVAKVLRNEIDPRLWPLAITIWHIRTSRRHYVILNGKDAWKVLQDCHAYNTDSAWEELSCVGLDEARGYFHNLHHAVQQFTTDFLSQATKCLSAGESGELHVPTTSEIYRVQRSFYYYELFCLIWGNGQKVPADWDLNVSWGLTMEFSPWMSEQVASVYEYLLRKLRDGIRPHSILNSSNGSKLNCDSAPFDEMAVQDGKAKITRVDMPDYEDQEKDFLVSWGLQYLFKLTDCPNYEDLHRILDEKRDRQGWFTLPSALKELNWSYYRDSPLENQDYMQELQNMDEDDSGPGPALLWCFAHSADDGSQFVLGPDYATLRQAGYVMWDAERKSQFDEFCQGQNSCHASSVREEHVQGD